MKEARIAILCSAKDPAGCNIREALIRLFPFRMDKEFEGHLAYSLEKDDKKITLYTTSEEIVHCENIDRKIDSDCIIFISKHASSSKKPSLSVHSIGNWGSAELGGKANELCPSMPFFMKDVFNAIEKHSQCMAFELTLECTHHGPFVERPSAFVEIGSDIEQWNDLKAGEIIARSVMDALSTEGKYQVAFALGGPHYMPNFKQIMLKTDTAIGHCCPKHMLEFLDENMLRQAIGRCNAKPDFLLLDWKGLSEHKARITALAEKLGIEARKTKDLYKED